VEHWNTYRAVVASAARTAVAVTRVGASAVSHCEDV
jgi:hypothetical protein